jgi:gluconate 2-dehydrogenase gamma chain
MNMNRRDWILGSVSAVAWSTIASARQHARDAASAAASPAFEHFDPAAARDVSALAAVIVPSDDGPGAAEAGAVYFIDRALKTFAADQRAVYHAGLADLNQRRKAMFPASKSIADLPRPEQTELLRAIDKTDFFNLLRTHTILAWLGDPKYGGNRGEVGWKYIGFDDAGDFEPPFGYYDREAK